MTSAASMTGTTGAGDGGGHHRGGRCAEHHMGRTLGSSAGCDRHQPRRLGGWKRQNPQRSALDGRVLQRNGRRSSALPGNVPTPRRISATRPGAAAATAATTVPLTIPGAAGNHNASETSPAAPAAKPPGRSRQSTGRARRNGRAAAINRPDRMLTALYRSDGSRWLAPRNELGGEQPPQPAAAQRRALPGELTPP